MDIDEDPISNVFHPKSYTKITRRGHFVRQCTLSVPFTKCERKVSPDQRLNTVMILLKPVVGVKRRVNLSVSKFTLHHHTKMSSL